MPLQLTAPPAVEPIGLAEVKAFLRIDNSDEDALLATLIVSARKRLERSADLAFVTQGWTLIADAWPARRPFDLPLWPVRSVTGITLRNADGGGSALAPDNYAVDTVSQPARVIRLDAAPVPSAPVNGIEIAFVAGFGEAASDVPEPIRQGLLLLVAHGFERREPVVLEGTPQEMPMTVAALLAPYRRVRL